MRKNHGHGDDLRFEPEAHGAAPPGGTSVSLIFPPLVEQNFGKFFPSTAVLAAFLESHEIGVSQVDLNEDFALYLLKADRLAEIGSGGMPGTPAQSWPAAAARWASRHLEGFFDAGGRHGFGHGTDYHNILCGIAKPFLIDPDAETIKEAGQSAIDAEYREFYRVSGVVDNLPETTALVGISVPMGPQLVPALVLAQHLKAARPELRVVLGGSTLSLMDLEDIALMLDQHHAVDCVVRFDGEYPLLALARQAISGDWRPDEVPGVSSRTGSGVQHNKPGPGPDVNRLPRPSYPRDAIDRLGNPELPVLQARGCYWGKCDYCDFVELFDGSPPFRGRRPDSFVDEIESLMTDYGVSRFHFITESIPPAFARRMSQLLLDRGLRISWSSFAMVDRRFDRETLALMAEAGCDHLTIGMESMTTRVLELVHKSATREENIRFLRDARDASISLIVNFIPDLPSTTYDEAIAALADMEELVDCMDRVSVFAFEPTRSSNVGRNPQRFGLVEADAPATGIMQYALNHLNTIDPAMTQEQRGEVHRRFRQFADRINWPAPPSVSRQRASTWMSSTPSLTISQRLVDVWQREDGSLLCTHMRTFRRFVIASDEAKAIRPCLEGRQLTTRELCRNLGEERGIALITKLANAQLIDLGSTDTGQESAAEEVGESDGVATQEGARPSPCAGSRDVARVGSDRP